MSSEDDRLILTAWAEIKLQAAPPRCRRFVAALEAMSVENRVRFLAVAFLYGGDLRTLLPEKTQPPRSSDTYHRWPRSYGGWQAGSIIRCEGDNCRWCAARWTLLTAEVTDATE